MLRTLLEACRVVGTSEDASLVHAWVERLGLVALIPSAAAYAQGSE